MGGIIVDTSSNNGDPSKWNWGAMKAAGVIAVIAKATEGTTYRNPYYEATIAAAKAVGIDHAAYHFAHFTDPVAEANWFRSVAGPDAKVLDSETNTNVAWQNAFLVALNLPGYEELDYGSASTLPRTGIRSFLWPAAYGQGSPGFGDIWQDTDRATINGCPVQLDASEWLGSQADYTAFFHGITPGPAPAIQGVNMLAYDPNSKSGSWDLGPDGGIFTADGSQFYGSMAGNRWNWQAVGVLDGIAPWWDGAGWGYKVAVRPPGGGVPAYYRFPSSGTLRSVGAHISLVTNHPAALAAAVDETKWDPAAGTTEPVAA